MKSRALATLVVGDEAEKMAKWSLPLMKKYADQVDAELIILKKTAKNEVFKKPNYEKYQIGALLEDFKRVLFLDADILVLPCSPDVFKMVPEEKIGAVSVESVYPKVAHEKNSISTVLGEIPWTEPYFNTGVMLLSEPHKCLYQDTEDFLKQWVNGKIQKNISALNDQPLVNYSVNFFKFELHDLGRSFNFTRAWGNFHHRFKHYFIHYAGLKGNRDWQMRCDYIAFNSIVIRSLFSACPALLFIKERANMRYISERLKCF